MNAKQQLELCEQFLRELGKGLPDDERVMAGYASEATVQTDKDGKKLNAGWWPVPWKDGKWIDTKKNCYVCISSSIKTPNPKTGEMRYWRGETSFGHGLALMVDDIGTGKGSKGGLTLDWITSKLPPTAIVETSPNNFQVWYFLNEPEKNMPYFKAFILGFVANVLKAGGDNTIRDVARYGRMPCGINNKRTSADGPYKYAGDDGKPWNVRMADFNPTVRYSCEDIAAAFGYRIEVPVRKVVVLSDLDRQALVADAVLLEMAVQICSSAKLGEGGGGVVQMNMSGKYRIQCPWGNTHTNGDPFGAYFRGPIPGADVEFVFGCAHDTCRKEHQRRWGEFIDALVMPKIEEQLEQINAEWAAR